MTKPFKVLKNRMSPEQRQRITQEANRRLTAVEVLHQLRQYLNLTQEQVSEMMETNQSAISRLEYQDDFLVKTLSRYVKALGGELKIIASFPNKGDVLLNTCKYIDQ